MKNIKRRFFCVCAACESVGIIFNKSFAQEKKPRPFCGYSVTKGWNNTKAREFITHQAKSDDRSGVPQVINKFYEVLSIKPEIDIFIAEREGNAFATIAGGKKIIVVDVGFVEKVNKIAKTQWGAIQVLAHEIGHHIAGFSEDRHKAELNADYWSGQILQRLGASRASSIKAMMQIGSENDSESHPSKHRRIPTIEHGWDDALEKKIDYSFCENCKK